MHPTGRQLCSNQLRDTESAPLLSRAILHNTGNVKHKSGQKRRSTGGRDTRCGDVVCKWIGRAASPTRAGTTATTSTLVCSLVSRCGPGLTQSPEVPHKQHSFTTKRKRKIRNLWMISGFRRKVDANCALLGYYASSGGNCLPKFWTNLSVPWRSAQFPNRRSRCGVGQ